jgi:hypothetical protein
VEGHGKSLIYAQRDLFEQVYLDALMRTSKYQEALNILENEIEGALLIVVTRVFVPK